MGRLLGLGFVVQVVACAVVGVRLAGLALRTRKAPELFLGASFVLLGAVGYPLAVVARGAAPGLLLPALAAQDAACCSMVLATCFTFHAGGTRLALASGGLVALGFGASLVGGQVTGSPDAGAWYYLGFSLRAGTFVWASVESVRYARSLRRRVRVGLCDPEIANRFHLFALSNTAILAGFAVFLAGRLLTRGGSTNPWVLASTSLVGLVGGVAMWLAFFPRPGTHAGCGPSDADRVLPAAPRPGPPGQESAQVRLPIRSKDPGMQALVVAGLLSLCCVSVAVGVKLLLLARRTHGYPELSLGLFFLLGGGIGYPLSAAAPMSGSWQPFMAALSSLFCGSSQLMLFLFTARVFHDDRGWARAGVAMGVVLCLAYILGYSISQVSAKTPEDLLRSTMVWGGVSLVMAASGYGWTSLASLRQYALQRRRLALGLADPVVTNRILLWGLMGATTIAIVIFDATLLYTGASFAREVLIPLVTCAGGLMVAVFLTLAFFPPGVYLDAVRRRSDETLVTAR